MHDFRCKFEQLSQKSLTNPFALFAKRIIKLCRATIYFIINSLPSSITESVYCFAVRKMKREINAYDTNNSLLMYFTNKVSYCWFVSSKNIWIKNVSTTISATKRKKRPNIQQRKRSNRKKWMISKRRRVISSRDCASIGNDLDFEIEISTRTPNGNGCATCRKQFLQKSTIN